MGKSNQRIAVLAVSGGVDSVVMLDFLAKSGVKDAVVAHFNHGIRDDSDEDEKLVRKLARKYGFKFESKKENLGKKASEELARERRYLFLKNTAKKHRGRIYTAHHADDAVESVAINLIRGTGWRGLAPLGAEEIERPMLDWNKNEIWQYAKKNGLVWREDSTNASEDYLRNRVRRALKNQDVQKKILGLVSRQREIKQKIDEIIQELLPSNNIYERDWFKSLDDNVAMEVLRAGLQKVKRAATRPQLMNFLDAVRTYGTGKKYNLGGDYLVKFGKKTFVLEEAESDMIEYMSNL